MEVELAKLIFEYKKHKRRIDNNFINRAINIMIEHMELENFVSNFKNTLSSNVLACYNMSDKIIFVNRFSINKSTRLMLKSYCLNNDIALYLIFINYLNHEIEHAKQQKQILLTSNDIDIESLILYEEFRIFNDMINGYKDSKIPFNVAITNLRKYKKVYNRLYSYAPSERLANINAFDTSINISKILDDRCLSEVMESLYYFNYLIGYSIDDESYKNEGPTKYYLDNIGTNSNWNKIIDLSHNINSLERIKLGLKCNNSDLYDLSVKSMDLLMKYKKR